MAKRQQRITLADVAERAGVSQMTVSRVVNNTGRISAATRDHVQSVVKQLGYRPSSIARSLVTNRTYLIGLVVPDITNPFFATIVRGVQFIAWQNEYNVLLVDTHETPEQEQAILDRLDTTMIDGLIVASSRLTQSELEPRLEHFTNVVLINQFEQPSRSDVVIVNSDFHGRTTAAVRHLATSGRKKIGCLSLNHRHDVTRPLFFAEGDACGLTFDEVWCQGVPPTWEGGYHGAHAMLAAFPDLEGLIGGNDMIAMGIMRAAKERGLHIPDDLAIIGGDDTLLASQLTPPLTSFRVDCYGIGTVSATHIFNCIENTSDYPHITFPDKIVVRESAP